MQTKFYLVHLQIHYKNVSYLAVLVTLRLEKCDLPGGTGNTTARKI